MMTAVHEVEVFFDGDCPLCVREIDMLRRLDARRGRVVFTDIAAPGFDPSSLGLDFATLMARIHGRLPDGTWIEGVEVFRRLYAAVGFRWLVPVTRVPGVSHALELGYQVFAKNRLKWTGRCVPDASGACQLPGALSVDGTPRG